MTAIEILIINTETIFYQARVETLCVFYDRGARMVYEAKGVGNARELIGLRILGFRGSSMGLLLVKIRALILLWRGRRGNTVEIRGHVWISVPRNTPAAIGDRPRAP